MIWSLGGGYIADKQTIIYNLGLAVYDLFFAAKIYNKLKKNEYR